ncbi:MAG: DUF1016 family protein [Proteobacteria bacterium]|nr:DUF1016 family protein [Pseudomonadota bacterium]
MVQLTIKNYGLLLKEVKDHLSKTQASIESVVVRKKVEMAWSIGKSISNFLKKNSQQQESPYGKKLFLSLQNDTGIEQTTLYRMYGFYKSYPILPKNNDRLNWSHYQLLSGVKNRVERKYLEDLVSEKTLSVTDLRGEIKKVKKPKSDKIKVAKLKVRRGSLFCYKLVKPYAGKDFYIDCGFKIYRQVTENLPKNAEIIQAIKAKSGYSLKKSVLNPRQIYTYKASLKRIVDGDTLHVTLDLGFGILHEETLRLTGINAAEVKSDGGTKATEGLKKILQQHEFFVVRTSSTDTYNRYLADIFLPQKPTATVQEVAESGVYLNQLLLDLGLAQVF